MKIIFQDRGTQASLPSHERQNWGVLLEVADRACDYEEAPNVITWTAPTQCMRVFKNSMTIRLFLKVRRVTSIRGVDQQFVYMHERFIYAWK
ncbi:hypothetical protein POVWA2_028640 [Plasmodium ovale wallikeri]|uniref:Uncharacterized protein n=1 Tax=Plasmodium ovale wallikeri TaxID=864142 RepID=A0A1A8YVY6_PLAOA|nr:hypothetical protein POVWA1_028790 [Plasmodium ovale wallikeri]SBT36132.1 hypothetical protein POVWA2_028640 [Plasmodium ovale wallikeri]